MRDPGNEVGIVIGAFRSILLLSILMRNKQIFQSCWLFLAEQKYDFVPLHNSKLHRRARVHNITMIDHWQLSILVAKFHFCSRNSFKSGNFWGGSSPPCPSPCYGPARDRASCLCVILKAIDPVGFLQATYIHFIFRFHVKNYKMNMPADSIC